MALKHCRECGKRVSDQAETCPGCGIKNPANHENIQSESVPEKSDHIILTMNGVIVTTTLAKFKNQTFPINGIGSVTLVSPKYIGLLIGGIILFVLGLIMLFQDIGIFGSSFVIVGCVSVGIAVYKKHGLIIKTASGDIRAMESRDKKILATVKEAIERAATVRG